MLYVAEALVGAPSVSPSRIVPKFAARWKKASSRERQEYQARRAPSSTCSAAAQTAAPWTPSTWGSVLVEFSFTTK